MQTGNPTGFRIECDGSDNEAKKFLNRVCILKNETTTVVWCTIYMLVSHMVKCVYFNQDMWVQFNANDAVLAVNGMNGVIFLHVRGILIFLL